MAHYNPTGISIFSSCIILFAGVNPCVGVSCGPGQSCIIDRYGIARCECPPECEPVLRPVCGSDGATYDSPCALTRAACLLAAAAASAASQDSGDPPNTALLPALAHPGPCVISFTYVPVTPTVYGTSPGRKMVFDIQ
ncbi:hypothetical protein J437_LFUL003091 [Ladona fulva]|uniref:Kazal-like domain-containing protein n=1 Tax=Ladona fulva TaxID=123851 RepID=A0A8K0NWS8_LADFU|nr:hypothetical protein J437_LFUL003091 [Ladona fulva]